MKVERDIFGFLGLFYLITGLVYFFVFAQKEWVGLFVLILSAGLSFMITGYLWVIGAKNDAPLSNNADAEIADGAGSLGFFPPQSKWPLFVALTAALVFLGPVFGWWLTILGFGFGAVTLTGLLYEFYRGDHAH